MQESGEVVFCFYVIFLLNGKTVCLCADKNHAVKAKKKKCVIENRGKFWGKCSAIGKRKRIWSTKGLVFKVVCAGS